MIKPTLSTKQVLYQQCLNYIQGCIGNVEDAIHESILSANNETKSSAGDKHETGRALLQLEQEKNTKQLTEMLALREKLLRIDPLNSSEMVSTGSIVITSAGNFYIAIAGGKMEAEESLYVAISPFSPIGIKLFGLRVNDKITFNGCEYQIRYVL